MPDFHLKCTKFNFGCGSAPDPAGGAHSAPLPKLDLGEGKRGKGKGKGKGEGGKEVRVGGSVSHIYWGLHATANRQSLKLDTCGNW